MLSPVAGGSVETKSQVNAHFDVYIKCFSVVYVLCIVSLQTVGSLEDHKFFITIKHKRL